jgi:hypothetical protein
VLHEEKRARQKCARFKEVYDILAAAGLEVPDIFNIGPTYIDLVYIPDLSMSTEEPNWSEFHDIPTSFGEGFLSPEQIETRFGFFHRTNGKVSIPLPNETKNRLHNIGLEEIEYVIENDTYKFLHMDATRKNYMKTADNKTIWFDFGDARQGPESYDKVHWRVDCFSRIDYNMDEFSLIEKKAALANSLRQYAIFHFVGNHNNLMSYIENVKHNCNVFLKELDYDIVIP